MSAITKLLMIVVLGVVAAMPAVAQDEKDPPEKTEIVSQDIPEGNENDPEEKKEAEKINAYYSNYLSEYKLGPQDIISVDVFGQCPAYCRSNLSVPPTARISYPLIREGVFVGGRTVEEVADEITKQLSEYIIDPKVTVTLNRPGSARYAVMGKVAAPGVRVMDRRVSINEAIIEAGGYAKGASKSKIIISRFGPDGRLMTQKVDMKGIESGKVPTVFLKPGDQVFVGKKGFTWSSVLDIVERASIARVLFGSPF